MEQRPLRLGDIVDDYCTRERRVTNHVIVALVEDAIRQTRCTTCDAEHAYKGAKEPRLRKKAPALGADDRHPAATNGAVHAMAMSAAAVDDAPATERLEAEPESERVDTDGAASEPGNQADAFLSHRRLIRATLPRTDDELPPPRPIPEFTMYQKPPARGARFRFRGGGNPNANGNGNGNSRDGFGNGRPGQGQGGRPGGRHRGKRRSR